MPFLGGDYRCKCGLRWWIEDHNDIQREPGSLACDCGEQIIEWGGSRAYSKIPMFRDPTVTNAELIGDNGIHIPRDSVIIVSHVQTHEGNLRSITTYRRITFQGNAVRVKENDLFAAATR
jgi:hypothetical protein